MRRPRMCGVLAIGLGVVALIGCTEYHKVTDRTTGEIYYTTNWDLHEYGQSSAVRLRDHTGQIHHLDEADVMQIGEPEYRAGIWKQTEADEASLGAHERIER